MTDHYSVAPGKTVLQWANEELTHDQKYELRNAYKSDTFYFSKNGEP